MLLDCMRRNSVIRPERLAAEAVTKKIEPSELKRTWLKILTDAERLVTELPATTLGCLYVDAAGLPLRIANAGDTTRAIPHYGSIGGSWPRVVE